MKNPINYTLAEIETLLLASNLSAMKVDDVRWLIKNLVSFVIDQHSRMLAYQVQKELKEITTRQNEPTRRQQNRGDVEAQAECVWIPFEENS